MESKIQALPRWPSIGQDPDLISTRSIGRGEHAANGESRE
jgi:hypothetical protein